MASLRYFGGTLVGIPADKSFCALTVHSGLIELLMCIFFCGFDNWHGGDTENGIAVAKVTITDDLSEVLLDTEETMTYPGKKATPV